MNFDNLGLTVVSLFVDSFAVILAVVQLLKKTDSFIRIIYLPLMILPVNLS